MEIDVEKSIDAEICGYVGRGVASVRVDEKGHLIFTMTDGEVLDLGPAVGSGGDSAGETATVVLDSTLTRPDMAAEAKATGDAISQAESLALQGIQAAQDARTQADTAKELAESAELQALFALGEAQTATDRALSAMDEAQIATQAVAKVVASTGDLGALETDCNGNLVEAINELHQELERNAGSGSATVQTEAWTWSDQVEPDSLSLAAFPATAEGIRLRVYCMDANGETVVFPIQPPENMGFEGGMLYAFDHRGAEVSFEDTGDILYLTAGEELSIYGFYYTTLDASSGGNELWRDEELAFGAIIAGEDLTKGMETGLTVGHLRAYRKWLFRLKNEGSSTLSNFYIMAGNVMNPDRGTAIFRFTGSGASIFYEWWDKDRTKLAMRSVFVGDSARIADPGEPVAIDGSAHWTYHDVLSTSSIDRLTDLEGYDDDTPVWLYCPYSPSVDYIWDFRGVTQ